MNANKIREILAKHAKWLNNMNANKIREILAKHAKWLNDEDGGERANLREADLTNADLRWADLREANLTEADLSGADLREANLRMADLTRADLTNADLRKADLRKADLRQADLTGANFDFSAWPLHCGSTNAKADDRLIAQLIYHVTRLDVVNCSGGLQEAVESIRRMAASDLFCEYRTDLQTVEEFLSNQKGKG